MKIGELQLKNNVFLAPMAGITELVFRTIVRRFGCSLCFTEMVSANGLVRKTEKSYRYIESSTKDSPLGIQIFGSDPDALSEASKIVTDIGADLIDVNMGCPAKKVLKTGAGAALMKDPLKIAAVLNKVRKSTQLPLTVKIRSGWRKDRVNAIDVSVIAEDCGVDALILHPRTVEQGFSGTADWELISKVKERLSVPVIGSGDIRNSEDALKMFDITGCDGVMVGRGALGNPWIFRDIIGYLASGETFSITTLKEREDTIREHLDMNVRYFGKVMGVKNFRKHILWYTKGLKRSAEFRQMVVSIDERKDLLETVHRYFALLSEFD